MTLAQYRYVVVIDAGSSGSRVQVLRWATDQDHVHKSGIPRIEARHDWQYKVEPGISAYHSNTDAAGRGLRPLLDFASSLVPQADIRDTELLLFATAGMRLLPDSVQRDILASVCRFARTNYAFRLADCSDQISVISGEQEALYGWVAVNYLLDRFDRAHAKETFGFMDMGGASTQIAFEPAADVAAEHAHDLTRVTLNTIDGRKLEYNVFVSTWLGYGTTEARRRYVEALVTRKLGTLQVGEGTDAEAAPEQPAAHYVDETTGRSGLLLQDPCLPHGLILLDDTRNSGSPDGHIEAVFLEGTGSYDQCLRDTMPTLNKAMPCTGSPCTFDGRHVPPLDFDQHHFVGVSEYWYSSHDMLDLGGHYVPEVHRSRSQQLCKTPWAELERNVLNKSYPNKMIELNRAHYQCFKAAWITNIIHEGFGLPSSTLPKDFDPLRHQVCPLPPHSDVEDLYPSSPLVNTTCYTPKHSGFRTLDTVNDIQISWTLGAILLRAGLQSSPSAAAADSVVTPVVSAAHPPVWLAVGLLLFLLLLLLLLLAWRRRVHHRHHTTYLSESRSTLDYLRQLRYRAGYYAWRLRHRPAEPLGKDRPGSPQLMSISPTMSTPAPPSMYPRDRSDLAPIDYFHPAAEASKAAAPPPAKPWLPSLPPSPPTTPSIALEPESPSSDVTSTPLRSQNASRNRRDNKLD
ncbi:Golgi apyrase [Sorochytrium milnesiophthora]